ncbi:Serine/threonine-protein phosphatase 2A activator 2 [Naganishia albida]|nr:Serine/threonine-protein phosphatase 2A activator 2 [Naganishia albida]
MVPVAVDVRLPRKRILSQAHLKAFKESETYTDIVDFVEELNAAIVGKKLSDARNASPAVRTILGILDEVEKVVQETPPVDNAASRFGNPAFKTFYDKVEDRSEALHEKLVSAGLLKDKDAIPELRIYFNESWGNRTRIDYGSGMELNFLCWLLCLRKLGVIDKADDEAVVLSIFWRYITIMRVLQSTYWLEPAGSHGVWGLDDYHFLPFLWGSGQLADHKHLRPKAIHDPEVLEAFSKDYMYFACIQFINSIKTASLRWHSPMLDDISAVKTWAKVNEGMIKMYKAEVLGKLPVVQHFYFGKLLPFPDDPSLEAEEAGVEDEHGHIHGKSETGWTMDCCGIPVPSVFAAAAAAKGDGSSTQGLLQPRSGLKPIPFD